MVLRPFFGKELALGYAKRPKKLNFAYFSGEIAGKKVRRMLLKRLKNVPRPENTIKKVRRMLLKRLKNVPRPKNTIKKVRKTI